MALCTTKQDKTPIPLNHPILCILISSNQKQSREKAFPYNVIYGPLYKHLHLKHLAEGVPSTNTTEVTKH